jgi:hypothetical protein
VLKSLIRMLKHDTIVQLIDQEQDHLSENEEIKEESSQENLCERFCNVLLNLKFESEDMEQ